MITVAAMKPLTLTIIIVAADAVATVAALTITAAALAATGFGGSLSWPLSSYCSAPLAAVVAAKISLL